MRKNRSSHRRCSVKKGVYRNFAKFTGKNLCQNLFFLIKLQASRRLLLENPQMKTGPDYSFPLKQFGKKKRICQASWFKNFSCIHYSKEQDSVFCIFCIKHKGKLTAEHNLEEAYITQGFNNWKKVLEAFVDHQQPKAHRAAITYEFVVLQCDDVLEMMDNDLINKRLFYHAKD